MKLIKTTFTLLTITLVLTGCDKNPLLSFDPDKLAHTLNVANRLVQQSSMTEPSLGDCSAYFADDYKEGDGFLSIKDFKKEFKKPCEDFSTKLTTALKKESLFSNITTQQLQDKELWTKYRSSKFAYDKKSI